MAGRMDEFCTPGNEGKNLIFNIFLLTVGFGYILWCHMDANFCDVTKSPVFLNSCDYVTFFALTFSFFTLFTWCIIKEKAKSAIIIYNIYWLYLVI